MAVDYTVIVLYLAGMLAMGWWGMRRARSNSRFERTRACIESARACIERTRARIERHQRQRLEIDPSL